jgi:enoyl-CoA hydratase
VYDHLCFERKGDIAILTIDNADKMNALSFRIINDIGRIVTEIEKDKTLRVLIVYGNEKIFGAGADLNDLSGVKTVKDAYESAHRTHLVFNRIENLPIPTIAAVAGFALGACFELSLACDLRIVNEKVKFGLPEISLGLMPGGGGSPRLAKLVGASKAKEIMFLGEPVRAEEAYRLGIANRIVENGKVFEEAFNLAKKLAESAPRALEMIKASVKLGARLDQASSMEIEARCFSTLFNTEDAQEGIKAFLEKKKPTFIGK